jgi:FG-GAP-like repeat/FG-GAP repeat
LAVANLQTPGVAVLINNGKGRFQPAVNYNSGTSSVVTGDFNGDGILDLAVGDSILLGNGNGTFQPPFYRSGDCCNVAVGDFNGDGKLDLISASGPWSVSLSSAIAVGDFNGDGKPDLAGCFDFKDVVVLINTTR